MNSTINQLDITDSYQLFHPRTVEYTFFSSSPGAFTEETIWTVRHTLANSKKTEIILHVLIPNGIKLDSGTEK